MKKMIVMMALVVVSGVTAFAAGGAADAKKMKIPPEELQRRKAMAMAEMMKRTGGFLLAPKSQNRVVCLVNQQKSVDKSVLEEVAAVMNRGLDFEVVVAEKRPDNAGIIVEIRESDYPATILTCPENAFGMLNVAKLKTDNPDAAVLKNRVMKETWRTLMYLLGAGNDEQPICLMKPVATLKMLDDLQSTCPCPMTFDQVTKTAAMFGVVPARKVTYRQACKEGWAPAPTNEFQKVIWAEFHAKPTEPMKVKFDPKKGE